MKAPSLTIGIEEEYQIIDPETRELRSYITQFMESEQGAVEIVKGKLKTGELKPELHASMVELGTPVCSDVFELKEALVAQRTHIAQLAEGRGLRIAAASTHPFSHWMGQEIAPFERYSTVVENMRMLAQRMLIFGMHVHIGVEDRDFAIDCMNMVRYMLPHILVLTTSSPFWAGKNTGMKSYRSVIFEDIPRTGLPESFQSWADFERFVQRLVNTGCIPDGSKIWWDVRPHYSFPTVEFRVPDICTTLDDAIAVAALLQAIVSWLWTLRKRNMTFRMYRRDLIAENKWRALRYGLDGKMIDFGKAEEIDARQLVRELLILIDDEVERLGSRREIDGIYRILEHGTSADRQLSIYQQRGGEENHDEAMRSVVDFLVGETANF
ncbi:MAG: carboxylate-amine ligase [Chloroflexota bacterium]|nr:carboxylate-amine ligase [Chloroflexota bacterium]